MKTEDLTLAEKHIKMHSNGTRKWCKFCSGTPLPDDSKMSETRYGWVSVKEEVIDGRPHMPAAVLASTAHAIFDPQEHTDFKLMIRTGAGPEGELISNYKLYQISKFDMAGFRIKAIATIELPIWRQHEEEWFRAFVGAPLEIKDPGLAGTISKTYFMDVTDTDFQVTSPMDSDDRSLEARIVMRETLGSALRRHKSKSLVALGTIVGAVISGGIGSAITILAG